MSRRPIPAGDRPFVIDPEREAGARGPDTAAPVPDGAFPAEAAKAPKSAGGLGRFALWAFGALFTFALSVAAYDFVAALFQRNDLLGWIALGLVAVAVLALAALGVREWAGYLRLGRIERLRQAAEAARAGRDLAAARTTLRDLADLYAARPDLRWARARIDERAGDILDADALLTLTEAEFMATLDARAEAEIRAAARQVGLVTAIVPLALADVAAALWANLRMVRRLAQIYGGRAGGLQSWRLLRRVFASLVATGALALTDDMIGSVAGGGILSRLSRRFGEGVVNAALTARIGIAAMEACRPLPFVARKRPAVGALVSGALGDVVRTASTRRRPDAPETD